MVIAVFKAKISIETILIYTFFYIYAYYFHLIKIFLVLFAGVTTERVNKWE